MSQAGILDIENSNPQIPTSFVTNSGTAIPIGNVLNIFASNGITTTGSGMTVNVVGLNATAGATALLASVGVASFNSAQFTVTSGFVSLIGGGGATETFTTDVSGPVSPDGAANIAMLGATNIYSNGSVAHTILLNLQGTNHALYVGRGSFTPSANIAVGTNGQVVVGATGSDPAFATLTSSDGSISFTTGANSLSLQVAGGTTVGKTITGTTGGPLSPTGGNWNILGAVGAAGSTPVQTVGGGSTLTVTVQKTQAIASTDATKIGLSAFDSADFTVDGNGFVSASSTGFIKTITGSSGGPIPPTANNVNLLASTVAAGTTPIAVAGSGSTLTINVQKSQAIAAADTTKIGLSNFDSARFTVDSTGFVSTSGTGIGQTITGQSGGALSPTAGNWNIFGGTVAAGTSPLVSSGSGSTLTLNAQRSQAIASTDSTKIGMAAFNSADFTVDSNGFVSAQPLSLNYTNVNHAASPYTVLTTDYYISVDCSGGSVTLNFPNSPTAEQVWIIKDRTGNAATSNISITTPGGTVTFDGATTYKIISNYGAINLLANATPTYEVY